MKNRFKLTFDLTGDPNTAYTCAYYASDATKGFFVETAVAVQKGKGESELATHNPTLLRISSGNRTVWAYVERGDNIRISGKGDDMIGWEIGGNRLNEQWSRWRKENGAALRSGDAAKVNDAVARFVRSNPSDPLSTLLLQLYYNRREDNKGFLSLWHLLRDEAAAEIWIRMVNRNDLYTNRPLPAPDFSKPHTIVLKSFANGSDTIRTGEVPVMLYFWRNSDKNRKEGIDSLRALRKANPDSAKFIIADICFDADSLGWASPLGRDSLRHTIRAWNPIAEADSLMRSLGVERTPAMILIEPINKK